jgi:DNA (cytosine-5)-methyltransferase 1
MQQKTSSNKSSFTAIDLFSGGGGMTVGLKRAGFEVVSAVEVDENAVSTYQMNHPEVNMVHQDIRDVRGMNLRRQMGREPIDLLAGCPPCQGFSSLTRKYRRQDSRNQLVAEMSRLVKEIRPRVVMMENVPGLLERGKPLLNEFIEGLKTLGYDVNYDVLQVADFGVPQNRRRLVLLAGNGFSIPLPRPTHSRSGQNELPHWRSLRSVIWHLPNPVTFMEAKEAGGPIMFNWHVVRNISDENIQRLRYAKPGKVRAFLPKRLRPKCHKNFDSGFNSVYGRMSWDQTPVTITGGCTTFSKGRFGHPSKNRTISVLEAALIQTFPRSYIFDTEFIDSACSIIGNALPCDFAEVVAKQCWDALRANSVN